MFKKLASMTSGHIRKVKTKSGGYKTISVKSHFNMLTRRPKK